jgi:uncharacterized SAM-binding protein YcdF (DUF218 family)
MLFLNKLLPIFVLPLGWVVLLLLWALIRRRRWPFIAAFCLLYLSCMPLIGNRLTLWLESSFPAVPIAQAEKVDAIVPLGGIFGPPAAEGFLPNLLEGGGRLEAGILLWQQKKADYLVFTGGRIPWAKQAEVEGAISMRAAIARGIPAEKILVSREVGNTIDEAYAVASLMRERGWTKILLVTSAWHMPRASRLFNKAGVSFLPFPVDFQVNPKTPLTMLDFLPRAGALLQIETALRECYGILFYAIR